MKLSSNVVSCTTGEDPGPQNVIYQPYQSTIIYTVPIKTPNGVVDKTLEEIADYMTNNGYGDSFSLSDQEFGQPGLLIMGMNTNEISDLYIGDRTSLDLDPYPIWIKTDAATFSSCKVIYCNDEGDFTIYTNRGNPYTRNINGDTYYFVGSRNESNTNVGAYATLYLSKTYQNVFINGELQT